MSNLLTRRECIIKNKYEIISDLEKLEYEEFIKKWKNGNNPKSNLRVIELEGQLV